MSARDDLSDILARLEGEAVRISCTGGDVYDLQILSAGAIRSEGSFDTTIIWAINSSRQDCFETGAPLRLSVDEVAKVELLKNATCVFERPIEPPPAPAP
jgi:hypothetical protein